MLAAACTDSPSDGAATEVTTFPTAPPGAAPPPTITLPEATADPPAEPPPIADAPATTVDPPAEPPPIAEVPVTTVDPPAEPPPIADAPVTTVDPPAEPPPITEVPVTIDDPPAGDDRPGDASAIVTRAARPASTPYVLPVAATETASWSDTRSGYPATNIFVPGGCGEAVVSPVAGALIEVRRVDSWDRAIDDPTTRGGRSIAILGDDGVRYYLANLDVVHPAVEVGARVEPGRFLGQVGDTGRTSACQLHVGFSPPCSEPEWSVRRGVVWPHPYLDAWRDGEQLSPALEVLAWLDANPDACAIAATT